MEIRKVQFRPVSPSVGQFRRVLASFDQFWPAVSLDLSILGIRQSALGIRQFILGVRRPKKFATIDLL